MSEQKIFHFEQGVWQIDGSSTATNEMLDPSQWERWLSADGFTAVKIPSATLWEAVTFNAVPEEFVETTITGTIPIGGFVVNEGMLRYLVRQGKRYPRPRPQKSKAWRARIAKKYRDKHGQS